MDQEDFFFLIHDATQRGFAFRKRQQERYADIPSVQIKNTCMTFAQAEHAQLPERYLKQRPDLEQWLPEQEKDRSLLLQGRYAHLEEVPPLRLMRMVYNQTVGRFDEVGFG